MANEQPNYSPIVHLVSWTLSIRAETLILANQTVFKNPLAASGPKQFHPVVRQLRIFFALLTLASWLPASSHSLLQHLGFIHQVHAHHHDGDSDHDEDFDHDGDSQEEHEHGTANHPAADGQCVFSPAKICVAKPAVLAALPWFVAAALDVAAALKELPAHCGPSPPGVAPPEFSHRWQFCVRAALPVRAPSFVS